MSLFGVIYEEFQRIHTQHGKLKMTPISFEDICYESCACRLIVCLASKFADSYVVERLVAKLFKVS